MNDTIMKEDDEEIIDLTDLLEEGEIPLEDGGELPPEEDKTDVSSIAQEPETFDLGKEITMEDDVSVEEIESVNNDFDIEVSLSTGEEAALTEEGPKEEAESKVDAGSEEEIKEEEVFSEDTAQVPEDVIPEGEPAVQSEVETDEGMEPGIVGAEPEVNIDDIKKDIPVMLEGIARPIMGELIRELITATREMLPGIVEKVIREEIEKLKKV
ncbi:MAG: hypothetical protein J7J85_01240 [Deltaproteobacteria bacterium]|nr:hypothetical protein [Deltaproteobacteria bacterium]